MAHDDDPGSDGAARVARVIERELRGWFKDFFTAAGLLTRLPLVGRARVIDAEEGEGGGAIGRAARAFPFVGLVIGLIAGLAYALFAAIGLPDVVAGIIALAVGALLTGALHEDGLGASAGRPLAGAVFIGLGLALLLSLIFLSWTGLVALIIAGIGAFGLALLARRQIGGHTGDVLGATQQVTELLFLLTVAAIR